MQVTVEAEVHRAAEPLPPVVIPAKRARGRPRGENAPKAAPKAPSKTPKKVQPKVSKPKENISDDTIIYEHVEIPAETSQMDLLQQQVAELTIGLTGMRSMLDRREGRDCKEREDRQARQGERAKKRRRAWSRSPSLTTQSPLSSCFQERAKTLLPKSLNIW